MEFVFAPCSLRALMNEILTEQNMNFYSEKMQITAVFPDDDLCIVTDASRLKQVLGNLLNNSRKFTKEGYIKLGYTLLEKEEKSGTVCGRYRRRNCS